MTLGARGVGPRQPRLADPRRPRCRPSSRPSLGTPGGHWRWWGLDYDAVLGHVRQAAPAREKGRRGRDSNRRLGSGICIATAHVRIRELRRYCASAEYGAPSVLLMRGVQRAVPTAHARSTAPRRYCARAEYSAPSLLRSRGVQSGVAAAHARSTAPPSQLRTRGVQSGVAIAHARSTERRPFCARAEYSEVSPLGSLLLDATSRVRSWRCFPAPVAAGAAGARGEHPAAGAAGAEAFLERGAGTIARSAAAKIPGVLGGFLKLIALKASDPQGFDLLNSIMEHMPPESVDWYRKQVFILLFQRLPSSKPTKLIKRFLCCRPSLLGLFELPEDDTTPDKEHFIDTEDTPGYQTAFSQLAFAGKKEHDPVGQMVNNPRIQLAQSLHKLFTACPGRVGGLGSASLGCIQQRRNASVRMVSC
ncbi:uncharacterized protein [Pithys albifrons albifrons]|uniref:uncharacterized protein n=1 Tax=Pithys albifrons albifrons TaxID=3385563 RepID=UPI003A5D2124